MLSIFHPGMVWVWPKSPLSHNPIDWETSMGKFEYERWKGIYETLFSTYMLLENERCIRKVEVSNEKDGAFAVVDINTEELIVWRGRTCKTYVKMNDQWKMIAQTGVLDYNSI